MTNKLLSKLLCLAAKSLLFSSACMAGVLSEDIRIESNALGYALQYRVYVPEVPAGTTKLPTLYLTDGQWYLSEGNMVDVLDREIAAGNIEPVVAVFVDSRNPDVLSRNRRNDQFMCSQKYVSFFVNELVPEISQSFPVSEKPEDRVIGGLSFGGLNAACFGLMASNHFGGIAMQSPASDKHLKVVEGLYRDSERMPVKVFFSVGTKRDNTKAARKFHRTLVDKGYDVEYLEVPQGHSWSNWQPLLDDLLLTFFKAGP